jgi:hypothetical protein
MEPVIDMDAILISSETKGLGGETRDLSTVDPDTSKVSNDGDGSWIPRSKPTMELSWIVMEGETPKLGISRVEELLTRIEGIVFNVKGTGSLMLAPSKLKVAAERTKAEVAYEVAPVMVTVESPILKELKVRECCTPYFKLMVLEVMVPLRVLSIVNVRS